MNALDPQPDFVLYGGDLAQLGRADELELGQQILEGKELTGDDPRMKALEAYILASRSGTALAVGKH